MPDLISFSGIDGAGKTTLLLRLRDHFQILGVPVQTLSFWDDVAILSRLREKTSHTVFKGDPGIGSPERPVERRDKNVQAWYLTVARLLPLLARCPPSLMAGAITGRAYQCPSLRPLYL